MTAPSHDTPPLLTPRLQESVRIPSPEALSADGWQRAREVQQEVTDLAAGFGDSYVEAAQQVIDVLVPPSLTVMGRGAAGPDDITTYRKAVTLGLAAGQYEDAHDLAPAPDKTDPLVHSALVLALTDLGSNDVIAAYLVWAGHYVGRHGGEGLDRVAGMLKRDHPELS